MISPKRLDWSPMTETESRLYDTLRNNVGIMVPVRTLVSAGWPLVADPDSVWLKPHMSRLRQKVATRGFRLVAGYGGKGYKLTW